MIDSKPSSLLVSRARGKSVVIRSTVGVATQKKLAGAARALHFRYNGTGQLLDLLADVLVSAAGQIDPETLRRDARVYCRLTEAAVRAIRKSESKVLSLAVEHGISERQVVRIRARESYRWVR